MYFQTHFDSGSYDEKKKFIADFFKLSTLIIIYHDKMMSSNNTVWKRSKYVEGGKFYELFDSNKKFGGAHFCAHTRSI